MMSIRSLADFNRNSPGGAVNGWHRHRHRPGPELPVDTASEGWGLLTGHQRGPRPGHTRGLSHGHGHRPAAGAVWPYWRRHESVRNDQKLLSRTDSWRLNALTINPVAGRAPDGLRHAWR